MSIPESTAENGYEGRRFTSGDVPAGVESPTATYRQDGDLLWGEFAGGHARRGALTGVCAPDGTLDFAYCMVLDTGEIVSGRCHSTPETLADGRVRLHEEWERYGEHAATGVSLLEELPTATATATTATENENENEDEDRT
ncbi:hypothetical protein [Planomonospora sp. ID91781]|uniref:hypothetical protein n=1 Tax=Planomonospora sp. ID91781 TaxID=2738135 RepID=UPI0018C3EED9|nr:hypothetical protein [Planomonospora sp. ID91781]